jgi:hypothetical protein
MATESREGRLVAGTAMMAGATAASSRLGGSGDKFWSAFETKSGNLFLDLAAAATGALNFAILIENDLFKFVATFLATKLKNRHSGTPLVYYSKKKEERATALSPTISLNKFSRIRFSEGESIPPYPIAERELPFANIFLWSKGVTLMLGLFRCAPWHSGGPS